MDTSLHVLISCRVNRMFNRNINTEQDLTCSHQVTGNYKNSQSRDARVQCLSAGSVRKSECRKIYIIIIIYHITMLMWQEHIKYMNFHWHSPWPSSACSQHCRLPSKMRATAKREAWQCGWSANPTRCGIFTQSAQEYITNRCLLAHTHPNILQILQVFFQVHAHPNILQI